MSFLQWNFDGGAEQLRERCPFCGMFNMESERFHITRMGRFCFCSGCGVCWDDFTKEKA